MSIYQDKSPKDRLVDHIMEYESDTFSASGSKITEEEAENIADQCLHNAAHSMIEGGNLDGLMLTDALEEMREE